MDPLGILKEFVLAGQVDQVVIDDERVRFGDKYSFPKQSPTAFRARDGTGDFYSLEAVAFFIKVYVANPTSMGAYVAAVIRTKTQQIELKDREALRDYLTGKIQHTPHITDVVPSVAFAEPAAKKQRVDEAAEGEAAALKVLFQQEKQLRDRNSLLCAPGANFRPVLDMVERVLAVRKQQQQQAAKQAQQAAKQAQQAAKHARPAAPQPKQAKPAAPAFMKPSGRMERNEAAIQLKAMGGDAATAAALGRGYGIEAGAGAAAPPPPAQQQQQPQPAGGGGGHRSSRGEPRPAGGHHHKGGGSGRHHKGSSAAAASGGGSRGSGGGASGGPGGGGGGVPLILVPSALTAMVNMYNAKQLLEEGRFVRSEEAMAANPTKPTGAVDFRRSLLRSGPNFPRYQVTDKLPKPGDEAWNRVVAVIVQGKAWQFKGFPFKGADKGELMETFTQLFGAYFHYSDEKVPDVVEGWKVVKLPVRRHARHLDHTLMLEFYEKLDAFLASRRCALGY